jgi:Serine/Threonine/Tyrosine Kinase found in polyvalent proteins
MHSDVKTLKDELQNIICGKGPAGENNSIQAAKAYFRNYTQAGGTTKNAKLSRTEEERALNDYASQHDLFIQKEQLGIYITEGAEQKVFYKEDDTVVYKIADAVFYTNWTDYFDNLLLHNYFFPDTAYTLIGFLKDDDKLFAVLQQPFVLHTATTNLEIIKHYLLSNGFQHKKNNDYYHPYLGIILEDLHDENVLTSNGVLFFVDTVFYLTEVFYSKT